MLHRVRGADLDTAASLLTRAMLDYPIFTYLVPNPASPAHGLVACPGLEKVREQKLHQLLRFILALAAFQGEIVAPSTNLEAIAVWVRSEDMRVSPTEALRAGLLNLACKVGLSTVRRLLGLAKSKQTERTRILRQPYYLLDLLGVDPRLQGKGYGRLLIETKLQQIDRECTPCYLETSDHRNIGYYQRYGFEMIHQHWVGRVPVYCLLRSAGASGS